MLAKNSRSFSTKQIYPYIDPAEIGKNIKTDIPIVGDAKNLLTDLLAEVHPRKPDGWNNTTEEWKKKYPLKYIQPEDGEILPQYVIDRISQIVDSDTIIVTDVGQHQMWVALFYQHKKPRSFLSSGGLGTMGYGLPAAMGAAMAFPERKVICISGDGSIQMNIQELATCAINKIPVKIAVLNNSYLGMVRQWQDLFWEKRYSSTCLKRGPDCPKNCTGPRKECPLLYLPNFVKVAEANGLKGLRAEKPTEVDSVLEEGLKVEGPALMLLASRGYNIESVIGAPTENPDIYKIHLVVIGTEERIEQVTKQLNKLVDTIKIIDISHKKNYIVREFILIKVNAAKNRSEIFQLIEVFRAKIVDVTQNHITIDLSGPPRKVERFIKLLKPFGIKEFVRSGEVAVSET